MVSAQELTSYLDALLTAAAFQDYDRALNGLQLDHGGPVRGVATAVDFSRRTIDGAVARGANFLVVHHGMFWGGLQRLVGPAFARLEMLRAHDVAVYSSHLPLDAHPEVGNCALLARELGLQPVERFGRHSGTSIGWSGACNVRTIDLLDRAAAFASRCGGTARSSELPPARVSRRWGILAGAGADTAALTEAAERGIDTLIVGEGPHHTTVEAPERGLVVIYAGHYATETLGVAELADRIGVEFDLPSDFLLLPTGS